jgi:hypothetical protein
VFPINCSKLYSLVLLNTVLNFSSPDLDQGPMKHRRNYRPRLTGHSKTYRDSLTRFFSSGFFYVTSSSKPLNITLGSFRMFFEDSLRYSQVKVHHRYQQHWWQILQLVVPLLLLIPVANSPLVSTIRYRR